jgi:hypothetical protein
MMFRPFDRVRASEMDFADAGRKEDISADAGQKKKDRKSCMVQALNILKGY